MIIPAGQHGCYVLEVRHVYRLASCQSCARCCDDLPSGTESVQRIVYVVDSEFFCEYIGACCSVSELAA